ncbi:alpha/beta hydrolase [Paenarthrobacter sp. NPDC089322]|uniref:alpha/beta fold hydrolase n=1 Tax=Paenarthrobacter sp. NPDC089322 TaxID=3155065 RepID=UPI00343321F9
MPFSEVVVHDTEHGFEDVTSWFFEDYLSRWVTAGAEGLPPEFITGYWAAPLWVNSAEVGSVLLPTAEAVVEMLSGMQSRLRADGYSHTVVPDRRITVFHDRGATIEVIWSRRRADESEIERLAVSFDVIKREDGWRAVTIQSKNTDANRLDDVWPVHRGSGPQGFSSHVTSSGVSYLSAGKGAGPVFIFTPGYRDRAEAWQWAARPLVESGHRVLLVNRQSAPAGEFASAKLLEFYAKQVEDAIEDAGLCAERVVLVGQSMGGPVAELAAVRTTARVEGLVLVNPAPLGGSQLPPELLEQMKAGTAISGAGEGAESKLGLTVQKGEVVRRRITYSIPEETPESSLQSLVSWVEGHPAGKRNSPVLARTLLVVTDDQFFAEDMLRSVVAPRFTNVEIGEVRGAGHYPHLEQPQLVADLIGRFAEELR